MQISELGGGGPHRALARHAPDLLGWLPAIVGLSCALWVLGGPELLCQDRQCLVYTMPAARGLTSSHLDAFYFSNMSLIKLETII